MDDKKDMALLYPYVIGYRFIGYIWQIYTQNPMDWNL